MYKVALALFLLLVLVGSIVPSAFAAINDSLFNPLWKKNNGKYLEILNGQSATLTTGYFGTNLGQVKVTATLNKINKKDVKIVSYLAKDKVVKMSNGLGYQEFTITPAHYKDTAGEYVVVIKLKDSNSERADSSLYLKVKPSNAITQKPGTIVQELPPLPSFSNTAPKMKSISDQYVFEDELVKFTVSATDKENDKLEYSGQVYSCLGNICLWLPLWESSFNQDSGVFAWTPNYDFVKHPAMEKNIKFRFKANDGEKDSDWEEVNVLVKDKNRVPYFKPTIAGEVGVPEGEFLYVPIHGFDPDEEDQVKITIANKPSNAHFVNYGNGKSAFSWKPEFDQAGEYHVTFTVKDEFGGEKSETIAIFVKDVNRAPKFNPITVPSAKEEQLAQFEVLAVDPDGDFLTYEAQNLPAGSVFEAQVFRWIPDHEQAGRYEMTFKVHDGKGGADKKTVNLVVQDVSNKPDIPPQKPQCGDRRDNDRDGKIDYGQNPANDPGCSSLEDDDESDDPTNEPQCSDGKDNDGDTKFDLDDPGCENNPQDNDESDGNNNDGGNPDHGGRDNGNGNDDASDNSGDDHNNDNDQSGDGHDNSNNETESEPKPKPYTNIKLQAVHVVENIVKPGEIMAVTVKMFNNGNTDLKEVKVRARVYDLGVLGSAGEFTLASNDGTTKNVYAAIPADAEPGLYLVKIWVGNSRYHTSAYRLVWIGYHGTL